MNEVLKSKDSVEVFCVEGLSHPHRKDLMAEAVSQIEIAGRPFVLECLDMGRVIGVDHLVETRGGDRIVRFDRGNGRNYLSRMVLNREAEPTQKVTVIICKGDAEDGEWEGKYLLATLFEGEPGKPEPYDQYESDVGCIEFWRTHALVPTDEERAAIESRV